IKYLQRTSSELEALFRDLLIGVTNFFRDPEVFKVLEEQIVPKLFVDKNANSAVRIWCPGCSTGEEAYSIAILLAERQEAMKQAFKVQVFATDIDNKAISIARAGLYPASIASDITPERLKRFFEVESNGSVYRIHKGIRDMLIFSEQDVVKDPPFSKLDLISCRNVMIYMGTTLQKKLIPLFHYALNPDGVLLLGTSETVGEFVGLFAPLDRKNKLYQRQEYFSKAERPNYEQFTPHMPVLEPLLFQGVNAPKDVFLTKQKFNRSLRELTERVLLDQIAPAGALVDGKGNILYLHGHTGDFLELSPGETGTLNILKMARVGLRRELTTAFHKASVTKEIVRCPGLRIKNKSHSLVVDLTIHPVLSGSQSSHFAQGTAPLYMVILQESLLEEEKNLEQSSETRDPKAEEEVRFAALKQELRIKEEYLQSANEELETSTEELKSSNEEMQSVNEELQSTNEELETSKEELQSVNEELSTVNAELQTKVSDLLQANNDVNNLLSGTGIGTVFVDYQLRILRFTPAVTQIINLILTDVGRPVSHILSNLVRYDRLVEDLQEVLNTLVPIKREVQTTSGIWYSLNILPYRTIGNVIEGAVITFLDINDAKKAEEKLKKANDLLRLAVVVSDSYDAIIAQDLDGRIIAWNPAAERIYGWSEGEALTKNMQDILPEDLHHEYHERVKQLIQLDVLKSYKAKRITKDGHIVTVWLTATALLDKSGKAYAISSTERVQGKKQ
ncbi:MAG: PAS domain-containing protein, partial [Spirochaetales bacterium]|nr:PAS domain-containing protein [Spirochaetales bacterium]